MSPCIDSWVVFATRSTTLTLFLLYLTIMHCTIIKTLAYQLRGNTEQETYQRITAIGLQHIDPLSSAHASIYIPTKTVYHSPLRRVIETIQPQHNTLSRHGLAEVLFDVRTLCDEATWCQHGSNAVRAGFVAAFIRDTLPQRRSTIIDETCNVLSEIAAQLQTGNAVTVISHSFRMKIIEALIQSQGALDKHPETLRLVLLEHKKTYGFGGFFSITSTDLNWL